MSKHRTPVPRRVRFEVFKRDRFCCRYCGRSAPDVVLEVDHVKPVAAGGDNDLFNLVTSCSECNNGKGAVPLSDDAAVRVARDDMAALQARREQLDMLLEWRQEVSAVRADELAVALDHWGAASGQGGSDARMRATMARRIEEYGIADMLEAIEAACSQYLSTEKQEHSDEEYERAWKAIPAIVRGIRLKREDPAAADLLHVVNFARRCAGELRHDTRRLVLLCLRSGMGKHEMFAMIKRTKTQQEFVDELNQAIADRGYEDDEESAS